MVETPGVAGRRSTGVLDLPDWRSAGSWTVDSLTGGLPSIRRDACRPQVALPPVHPRPSPPHSICHLQSLRTAAAGRPRVLRRQMKDVAMVDTPDSRGMTGLWGTPQGGQGSWGHLREDRPVGDASGRTGLR
jgi:hypothetical protein